MLDLAGGVVPGGSFFQTPPCSEFLGVGDKLNRIVRNREAICTAVSAILFFQLRLERLKAHPCNLFRLINVHTLRKCPQSARDWCGCEGKGICIVGECLEFESGFCVVFPSFAIHLNAVYVWYSSQGNRF